MVKKKEWRIKGRVNREKEKGEQKEKEGVEDKIKREIEKKT